MLLKDEIDKMDRTPKREVPPITQRRVTQEIKTPGQLVQLAQYHTILEGTLTKERTTVTRSDPLLNIVTVPKHQDTSMPETALILIEVVSRREAGHTPLEVTNLIPGQLLGYLKKRKLNGWLLDSVSYVGKQGISAATAPPNEQ